MAILGNLHQFRVMRLNALVNPIPALETELCQRYGINSIPVDVATPEELVPHIADCDALFVVAAQLPRAVIDSLKHCRLISRLGNGTDKIDVEWAAERGIIVSNVPFFCVEEIADHAMGMVVALSRHTPQMSRHMYAGTFLAARNEAYKFQRLNTQTVGLVGFGSTAKAVAKRAAAFGMRVIATRRNQHAPNPEAKALGVEMANLDTVLREADFVVLLLPLNAETYHLIDDAALRKMKPTANFINIARGAITDEQALAAALREGRLAGAAIDTFKEIEIFTESEAPPVHPLMELDNVILTPHVSGLSVQSMNEVSITGVANMATVLSGHWPHQDNIVNKGMVPWMPLADYDPDCLARLAHSPV